MDLKGSLEDTKLKIIPSKTLLEFINALPVETPVPINISKLAMTKFKNIISQHEDKSRANIKLSKTDIEILSKFSTKEQASSDENKENKDQEVIPPLDSSEANKEPKEEKTPKTQKNKNKANMENYLETLDIEWLYSYLDNIKESGKKDVPFLHSLLEGSVIKLPENRVLKRNPDLEARCVTLRAQQEAREYRKMTKTVDNVRMRYPEESISYQLKHLNRQLIAIGQFIISIFAGFLFGFRGVEWMVGNLDFGFRLLLGVMCALIIALAEIYFLAKKLNEEYSVPETVQLGGPNKFAHDDNTNAPKNGIKLKEKEHTD